MCYWIHSLSLLLSWQKPDLFDMLKTDIRCEIYFYWTCLKHTGPCPGLCVEQSFCTAEKSCEGQMKKLQVNIMNLDYNNFSFLYFLVFIKINIAI